MNENYTIEDFMRELAGVWNRFSEEGQDCLAKLLASERFKEEMDNLANIVNTPTLKN